MQFLKVDDGLIGATSMAQRLTGCLQSQQRVLWLIGGGSSIPLCVLAMNEIPMQLTSQLSILLTDERFGPLGHPDSNAYQLTAAGFNPKQATVLSILNPETDHSLEMAIARYQTIATHAFSENEVIIGQFGIGIDGHIAGILPHSLAVETADFATGYQAPPFQRLTLSFHALKRLHVAYVFAFGNSKKPALRNLQKETLPLATQPAQILKELPEAYIYNDQIGDI